MEKKVEVDEERSLTGKNSKLNASYDKVMGEKKSEGGAGTFGSTNPLMSRA